MRSIVPLVIGIVVGIAAGLFYSDRILSNRESNQRPTNLSGPIDPIAAPQVATRAEPAAVNSISHANPFSSPTLTPTKTVVQSSDRKPALTQYSVPDMAPSEIVDYRDLIGLLFHIDNADTPELQALLEQFEYDPNRAPFSPAIFTAIYQRWSQIDIDAAFDYALERMDDRDSRNGYLAYQGIELLARQYPEYAREQIDLLPEGDERYSLEQALSSGIAANDPEAYVRQIMASGTNTDDQYGTLMMAIMQWGERDPATVLEFLDTEADAELAMHREQLLYMWYEREPEAAIPEIEALLNDSSRRPEELMMLTDIYASHLAKSDSQGALQWAMAQNEPMMRENAMMSVIYQLESKEPDRLLSFIDQLGIEDKNRIMPMVAPNIASAMARTDPLGALEWARQLPPQQRAEAKMMAISVWVSVDPQAATQWLAAQDATAENQGLLVNAILPLMHEEPHIAKDMFQKLPATMQEQMIMPLVMSMPRDSVKQWLSEQSNPQVQAIGSIMLDSADPNADTISLLDRIAALQSQSRQELLFTAISMHSHNQYKVRQWIDQTPLISADERMILSRQIESGQVGFESDIRPGFYPSEIDLYSTTYDRRIQSEH